jgi:ubiquinone biosynthesis monooxygenase Coq7
MDKFILGIDQALRAIAGVTSAKRPLPAANASDNVLDESDQRCSAGLMRVNHVGEICAQAMYAAQEHFSKDKSIRQHFHRARQEEEDHLAWTAERLQELGARPSLLNPLWYVGAYTLGAVAARLGDAHSLGFAVETERQVEEHLAGHLERLPLDDKKSRAILEQMRIDEISHGSTAQSLGAARMPFVVQKAMQAMAKVMTTSAYYL